MPFSADAWVTQQLEASTNELSELQEQVKNDEQTQQELIRLRQALHVLNGREDYARVFLEDIRQMEGNIAELIRNIEKNQKAIGDVSRRIQALQVLKDSMENAKNK